MRTRKRTRKRRILGGTGMSVSEFVGEAPASADSAYEEHGSLASIDTHSGTALAGTDARY